MEQTPATRFVEILGRLGYKTQQQIADLLDIARPTAGTIVRGEREPSFSDVSKLKAEHDEVNIDWIFTGKGQALGRNLVSVPVSPPTSAEPEAQVPSVAGVERRYHAPMAVLRDVSEMGSDELASYYKALFELADEELTAMKNAQRHEEAVRLVRSAGGRSGFNDASADAADESSEPPFMVAVTNPDYVEAPEPLRRRIGYVLRNVAELV